MKDSMYYDSNHADIFIYNSNRKNAKCLRYVTILHLIPSNNALQLSDDSILNYFVSKLDECVYYIKQANNINFTCYERYGKETQYINANQEYYNRVYMFEISHKRQTYSTIEEFINYLYRVFMDIYPYSKLDINTIYSNWSIKHIISNYYK